MVSLLCLTDPHGSFEAGTLTAMNPAEGGDEDEEMEALKQENEDLKQQLADAQASAKATETAVEALQEEVKNFKSQVKSDLEGFGPDGVPKTENKRASGRLSENLSQAYNLQTTINP